MNATLISLTAILSISMVALACAEVAKWLHDKLRPIERIRIHSRKPGF